MDCRWRCPVMADDGCRRERLRAANSVVVSMSFVDRGVDRSSRPGFITAAGMGAIERWISALLLIDEKRSLGGRIDIEADDVAQLVDNAGRWIVERFHRCVCSPCARQIRGRNSS